MRHNVLILGGTPEAVLIADRLMARGDLHLITSLAGRSGNAAPVPGDVRIGGFHDAGTLADFIQERRVELLIDASDPFGPRIRRTAAAAAAETLVERVVFERPSWPEGDDDVWIRVHDDAEAADLLPGLGTRVMLDIGTPHMDAFSALSSLWFLVRLAERPAETPPLADFELLCGRPPLSIEQESALLRQYAINLLVLRDSGLESGALQAHAARAVGLPVILLGRPPLPPSVVASSVDEVLAWVRERLGTRTPEA